MIWKVGKDLFADVGSYQLLLHVMAEKGIPCGFHFADASEICAA